MKKIIAASILFTACGNSVPDKITLSVEQEKAPPACLALDGSCSEITTTTIDKNGVNTVKTEEPCDDAPVASPAVLATPAPTPAPVVVQTPAPFVPHYTTQLHQEPNDFYNNMDFSMQFVVEYDLNNNNRIDVDSENFTIRIDRSSNNAFITNVQSAQKNETLYWHPNEFVNDKKFTQDSVHPWDVIRSLYEFHHGTLTFFAWAPISADIRVVAICSQGYMQGGTVGDNNPDSNCGVRFEKIINPSPFTENAEGYAVSNSNPNFQFSDGYWAVRNNIKFFGRHLFGTCVFGGGSGSDACFDDNFLL